MLQRFWKRNYRICNQPYRGYMVLPLFIGCLGMIVYNLWQQDGSSRIFTEQLRLRENRLSFTKRIVEITKTRFL